MTSAPDTVDDLCLILMGFLYLLILIVTGQVTV